MKTIAIMNNKGGVGKTVTAINLADILARDYGKRVILADCDGQMNLTRFFFPEFDPAVEYTVCSVLLGECEPVCPGNLLPVCEGIDLLPGSSELYSMDLDAILWRRRPDIHRLFDFCRAAASGGKTDFFIIDCPPGYTSASVAALTAADEVVIPMQIDGFSFAGMIDMEAQLESLRKTGTGARTAGILLSQWRNSDVVRQGEDLVRGMGVPVFQTVIRRTEKVPESTFDRQPIVRYSPGSAAAQDYRRWVKEYLGGEL